MTELPPKPPPPPPSIRNPDHKPNGDFAAGHRWRFQPGNQFAAKKDSPYYLEPKRMFKTPNEMWQRFCEYCDYVASHPEYEEKVAPNKAGFARTTVAKQRPMTLTGFRLFAPFSREAWHKWKREREDLWEVMEDIEDTIYEQKFAGAVTGLMKENIISRDLGLAERQDLHAQVSPAPPPPKQITQDESPRSYLHPDDTTGDGPRLTHDQWLAAKRGELPLDQVSD